MKRQGISCCFAGLASVQQALQLQLLLQFLPYFCLYACCCPVSEAAMHPLCWEGHMLQVQSWGSSQLALQNHTDMRPSKTEDAQLIQCILCCC